MQPLDLRTFDLSGDHYAIGRAIGEHSAPFTLPQWWPEPPSLDFAKACEQQIAAIHAPLLDELYGHADGQAQDYYHLLRIVCRYRLGGRPVSVPEQGGCTSFAWRAADGHIRVGRNYDFYPVQRIRQRIRLTPSSGLPTLGMRGSVPCGRYDGVNHAGLWVSLHIVLAERQEHVRPGVPFHLIPRLVLELCENVEQAVNLLTQIPHIHSFNYLVADPERFVCVEAHSERLRIIYPEGDVLAVGNFYQHPDMQLLQRHRRQELSRRRVAYLYSKAWETGSAWESVRGALTDHDHGVCGHEGGHSTLWSAMADLNDQRIAYTLERPCTVPHEDQVWPGLPA